MISESIPSNLISAESLDNVRKRKIAAKRTSEPVSVSNFHSFKVSPLNPENSRYPTKHTIEVGDEDEEVFESEITQGQVDHDLAHIFIHELLGLQDRDIFHVFGEIMTDYIQCLMREGQAQQFRQGMGATADINFKILDKMYSKWSFEKKVIIALLIKYSYVGEIKVISEFYNEISVALNWLFVRGAFTPLRIALLRHGKYIEQEVNTKQKIEVFTKSDIPDLSMVSSKYESQIRIVRNIVEKYDKKFKTVSPKTTPLDNNE